MSRPSPVSLDQAALLLEQHGLVLPKRSLEREVRDERDDLLNRLARIGVLIPGIETVSVERLRDVVQWQEERTLQRVREEMWLPDPVSKLRKQDKLVALREYWQRVVVPRRESRKFLYWGSGVTALEAVS